MYTLSNTFSKSDQPHIPFFQYKKQGSRIDCAKHDPWDKSSIKKKKKKSLFLIKDCTQFPANTESGVWKQSFHFFSFPFNTPFLFSPSVLLYSSFISLYKVHDWSSNDRNECDTVWGSISACSFSFCSLLQDVSFQPTLGKDTKM